MENNSGRIADPSSESTTSHVSVVAAQNPLVLELHDIKDQASNQEPVVIKGKKTKLKKKVPQNEENSSSEASTGNTSVTSSELNVGKEEYFDAQDYFDSAQTIGHKSKSETALQETEGASAKPSVVMPMKPIVSHHSSNDLGRT